MKMIIAIVQSKDSNRLRKAFNKAEVHVTQLSTTGGFLREGNATFLIGVEDERVNEVLEIIKKNAESREQYVTSQMHIDVEGGSAFPVNVRIGGATVFILPVEQFLKF
ncbi:cyclic-di-AMP receptor [Limosilactobacillus viscerum]|uniref:cyclic-di-AMP receptor n=1 Tax=Limosilactobacillus viscerum TaxID=2993450 RepID=UPI0024BA5D77|nr:cyclic-di-AMP receptor [Limosilactobacillus viscerum]